MQYPFSIMPTRLASIERTLSPARLGRYLPAANGDKQLALRLYLWNARLCEALYLPMQFAEIAARNAIKIPVEKRFGPDWYLNHKFINILPKRMKDELAQAEKQERKKRGTALNQDHIVASLSFGFWVALMTSAYDKHLWVNGVKTSFPSAAPKDDRHAIYLMLDAMRKFRNDAAHHVAIFDRHPQREFQNALKITKLICDDTHWLSSETARVGQVISDRPKF
jgi:hypothetical protein